MWLNVWAQYMLVNEYASSLVSGILRSPVTLFFRTQYVNDDTKLSQTTPAQSYFSRTCSLTIGFATCPTFEMGEAAEKYFWYMVPAMVATLW